MSWQKSPPELIETFDAVFPARAGAEKRKMFGYPCGFVNGRMFAGLHEHRIVLRLDDGDRAELLKIDGAHVFEPMKGRPMKEYVVAPPAVVADRKKLAAWIGRSFDFAAALPPKEPKAAKGAKVAASARPKKAASAPAAKKPAAKKPAAKKPAAKKPAAKKPAAKKPAAKKPAAKKPAAKKPAGRSG